MGTSQSKKIHATLTPEQSPSSFTLDSRATSIKDQYGLKDDLGNTHYVLKHCFGDHFSAPVHDLLLLNEQQQTRVLDMACGYGVWVLEMATRYPHAQFHGIDAIPLYPQTIKPCNTTFQKCNVILKGVPYPDAYFDYIYMQFVYPCFSRSDLKFVLYEMNRVLKPGGYIELRDLDPMIKNPGPITRSIFSDFAYNMDPVWTPSIGDLLQYDLELTDIYCQYVSVDSTSTSFLDTLKIVVCMNTHDEDCIIQECNKYQSYFQYSMSWGRKPLVSTRCITPAELSIKEDCNLYPHLFDIIHLTHGFIE